ncbi:unnamed protein product [Thlaspi arvense]|uniref:C2H2-type domain-containing protein n=1 Tax=Thlaspi arvense TaxID=13288 RepID=A0AAU9S770_THLAR|nr:unnamed protein product [Thlaspi arvense]
MMQNKATQQEEKTLVLWHINSCPIPDGFDPRLIGRRIESALKKSGYCNGPLTITAIGDLRQTPVTPSDEVLREISSTGIALHHGEDEVDSGTRDNEQETTRLVLPDLCPRKTKSPWYCSVCRFASQSFDDFTTHLKSVKHAYGEWDGLASHHGINRLNVKPGPPNNDPETIKASFHMFSFQRRCLSDFHLVVMQEWDLLDELIMHKDKKDNKTLVLWDINSCPIPDGYDSRLVRSRIESAAKDSGFSGSLTITAISDLTHTPDDKVLRELSSAGIAFKHTGNVEADFCAWSRWNPPPATIMLIIGPSQLVDLCPVLRQLHDEGYTILLAYPRGDPALNCLWTDLLRIVEKEWLWKSLLEGATDNIQETTRPVLPGKSSWYCSLCLFHAQSSEDLIRHVKSVNHAFTDWDLMAVSKASHQGEMDS